jgi:tetratricopeptide (TPR) repeat protein
VILCILWDQEQACNAMCELLTNRGVLYEAAGNVAQALEDYEQALSYEIFIRFYSMQNDLPISIFFTCSFSFHSTLEHLRYVYGISELEAFRKSTVAGNCLSSEKLKEETTLPIVPGAHAAKQAHQNLAVLHLHARSAHHAIRHFDMSLRYEGPNTETVSLNKAVAFCQIGEERQALELLSDLAERFPGNPYIFANRAVVHHKLGNLADAEKDYTTAIGVNPADALLYLQRGRTVAQQWRLRDAMVDFSTALHLDGNIDL